MAPTPTLRLVLALALPVMAQHALYLVVNLSDRYLGGHLPGEAEAVLQGRVEMWTAALGDEPIVVHAARAALSTRAEARQAAVLAAQTTAHYLAWSISSYMVLITVGSTALVARFVGAGARSEANAAAHQSLMLAFLFGLLASAVGLGGGIHALIGFLQLQGSAAGFAAEFLWPLFGMLAFQVVEAAGIACLVGAGDTRTGLYVMVGVAVMNLPLAWSFCYGLGPFPRLGLVGIALGTALSHVLGCLVVLTTLTLGRQGLKLRLAGFRPRFDLMRRLLRVGVPAAFDSLSVVVGQFWFLSLVNQLGNEASSAHGIALVWEALGYLSGAAFGTAAMTLVGQNLGAGRPDQAARAGWLAFGLGSGVMTMMGIVFFTLAPWMFRVFTSHPPILAAGVPVLRLVAFAMPALASTIVFTSALRGAGDTRVPVLFTWIGFFVVRIPLAYFFIRSSVSLGSLGEWPGLGLGLLGAWLAMFADLVIRGGFFFYRFVRGAWKTQRV